MLPSNLGGSHHIFQNFSHMIQINLLINVQRNLNNPEPQNFQAENV